MAVFRIRPCQLGNFWVDSLMFTSLSSYTTPGFSLRTQAKGMSMPSNGLRLSQWDSLYANRIAAPLTPKLRLQESYQ